MLFLTLAVYCFTALAHISNALPIPISSSTIFPDAPFSVSAATVQAAITCPNGIQNKTGGIVFLIHGTALTGQETWGTGPYVALLPTVGKGFDVCFVDLPGKGLLDAQLSAEFVARGIQILAPLSTTGQVNLIGHSQGAGINPQWAFIFWPSIQSLVTNYIALAGDFEGTAEGVLLCNPLHLPTCDPSIWQQTKGSNYLAAQNSLNPGGGGRALVPTTSIFTIFDEVIQPEVELLGGVTSKLTGAGNYALQDLNVCGPLHIAEHLLMLTDTGAFGLVRATIENGVGPLNIANFDPAYCTDLKDNTLFSPGSLVAAAQGAFDAGISILSSTATPAEPPLQPYVCARGFATVCGAAFPPS